MRVRKNEGKKAAAGDAAGEEPPGRHRNLEGKWWPRELSLPADYVDRRIGDEEEEDEGGGKAELLGAIAGRLGQNGRAVLAGRPGCGKRTAMVAYATVHAGGYDHVVWLEPAAGGMDELADALFLPASDRRESCREVVYELGGQSCLFLVVSGDDDAGAEEARDLRFGENHHVIFASPRAQGWGEGDGVIRLAGFTKKESKACLSSRLPSGKADKDKLAEVVKATHKFPAAVAIAGRCLERLPDLSSYLSRLKKADAARKKAVKDPVVRSVAASCAVAVGQIEEEQGPAAALLAWGILRATAYLCPSSDIDHRLVLEICEGASAHVCGRQRFQGVLSSLEVFGLVRSAKNDTVTPHKSVQTATRAILAADGHKEEVLAVVLKVLLSRASRNVRDASAAAHLRSAGGHADSGHQGARPLRIRRLELEAAASPPAQAAAAQEDLLAQTVEELGLGEAAAGSRREVLETKARLAHHLAAAGERGRCREVCEEIRRGLEARNAETADGSRPFDPADGAPASLLLGAIEVMNRSGSVKAPASRATEPSLRFLGGLVDGLALQRAASGEADGSKRRRGQQAAAWAVMRAFQEDLPIARGAVTPRVRLLTSEGARGAALRSTLGHQLVQKAARLLGGPGPRGGTPGEAALGALHFLAGRDGFRELVAEMTGGYQVDPVFGVEFVTLAEGLLSRLVREWPEEEADAGFHPMTEMLERTLLELRPAATATASAEAADLEGRAVAGMALAVAPSLGETGLAGECFDAVAASDPAPDSEAWPWLLAGHVGRAYLARRDGGDPEASAGELEAAFRACRRQYGEHHETTRVMLEHAATAENGPQDKPPPRRGRRGRDFETKLEGLKQAAEAENQDFFEFLLGEEDEQFDYADPAASDGATILHLAARKAKSAPGLLKALVPKLKKLGHGRAAAIANVRTTSTGNTALMDALAAGAPDASLRQIVELGPDFNAANGEGNTVLHLAVAAGSERLVKELLAKRTLDVRASNAEGRGPLHQCARARKGGTARVEVATLLLDYGREKLDRKKYYESFLDAEDNGGLTPLLTAVSQGHRDLVEVLVDRGADIRARDNRGRGAAHLCAEKGNQDMTTFVTKLGGKMHAADHEGDSPLTVAARHADIDYFDFIYDFVSKKDPTVRILKAAALNPDHTVLTYLIMRMAKDAMENGGGSGDRFNVDACDDEGAGETALLHALRWGPAESVTFLLDVAGADVGAADHQGRTAAHYAAERGGELEVAGAALLEALVRRGANLGAPDYRGEPAAFRAVRFRNEDFVEKCLELDPEITLKENRDKETLLHLVSGLSSPRLVEKCLKALQRAATTPKTLREALNHEDFRGLTPALRAHERGNHEIIGMLCASGAKLHPAGWSPLHLSALRGEPADLTRLLKEKGVTKKLAAKTPKGDRTPLLLAAENGRAVGLEELLEACPEERVKDRTSCGKTVAHLAAGSGGADSLVALWSGVGEEKFVQLINSKDESGRTALMEAVARGTLPTIQFLLEHGAERDETDKNGWAAVHHALRHWDGRAAGVVKVLLEGGCRKVRVEDWPYPAPGKAARLLEGDEASEFVDTEVFRDDYDDVDSDEGGREEDDGENLSLDDSATSKSCLIL